MQAGLPEPVHLKAQQHVCHVIADPSNVFNVDLYIVLHSEEHEGTDQGHHGLAESGGLGHNMHYGCIVTMKEQALSF